MKNVNLELYKKIYLIRSAEKVIIENYDINEMKTPMHMSMGEEAIVAGICHALSVKDQVFGTYRSHALYLAKTGETNKFFAEMYGKKTGIIKGKGGSMHLSYPEKGLMATSAVVASTIPVAVGSAFANKLKKNKIVTAVFFGDGAIDEGAFWESLNLACNMKLPIIFVCEDNGFAVHTPGYARHGYKSISKIVSQFNLDVYELITTDVEKIYELAKRIKRIVLSKNKPAFLYTKYYRYLEHVGVYEDFDKRYRAKSEFEKWKRKDPLKIQKEKIQNIVSKKNLHNIEKRIDNSVFQSLTRAKGDLFPKREELLSDVYYEEN